MLCGSGSNSSNSGVSKKFCGNKKNSHTSNSNCSDVIVALGWGWAGGSKNRSNRSCGSKKKSWTGGAAAARMMRKSKGPSASEAGMMTVEYS